MNSETVHKKADGLEGWSRIVLLVLVAVQATGISLNITMGSNTLGTILNVFVSSGLAVTWYQMGASIQWRRNHARYLARAEMRDWIRDNT